MKKLIFVLLLVCTFLVPAAAQKTSIDNLYHTTLDNGLELFVFENPSVPLAYIEIAVKAGGIGQTTENAGLFHLYEHMMFKGNSLYKDSASVQKAINQLGVPSWNGSTGAECVNYYFTVPSDKLENGLAFWSAAIRDLSMDPAEFENEKKVVMSEISGYLSQPSWQLSSGTNKIMFPKFPWRLDPGGSIENIQNATVAQLKDIQAKYYVPNNAALFVGGDVKYEDVLKLVNKIYGTWKPSKEKIEQEPQLTQPFSETQYVVLPYPELSAQFAQVLIMFRGPDTSTDIESTYGADLWTRLIASPMGSYKQTLIANQNFAIPSPDYLSAGYSTSRENGKLTFSAIMLAPEQMLPQRAALFAQTISEGIAPEMVNNSEYFSTEEFSKAYTSIEDDQLWRLETSDGFLGNARFWWNTTSTDYYLSYSQKMRETKKEQINSFLNKYLVNKPSLVVVLINPDVYNAQKEVFSSCGYTELTSDNAYWFNDLEGK